MRKLLLAFLALAAAVVSPSGTTQHQGHGTVQAGFASDMDAAMKRMMEDMHRPGYSGDPDVDFLAMMIPHHEGAVEMARLVLVHGRDPLTRRLAEEIIASQSAEIAAMRGRVAILRRGADPDPGGFPALQGTRGGADR